VKAVIATWCALAVAAGIASCSISHKSDALACTKQSDCASGRQCINGYCVVTGETDAPPGDGAIHIDADLCPEQCTSCDVGSASTRESSRSAWLSRSTCRSIRCATWSIATTLRAESQEYRHC